MQTLMEEEGQIGAPTEIRMMQRFCLQMTSVVTCSQRMGDLDQRMPGFFVYPKPGTKPGTREYLLYDSDYRKFQKRLNKSMYWQESDQWLLVTGWRKACKQAWEILCDKNVSVLILVVVTWCIHMLKLTKPYALNGCIIAYKLKLD